MEEDIVVRQLSVFLENRPGSLAEVLQFLADRNIDLCALSLSESRDFDAVRLIAADADVAADALAEGAFHFSEVDVLAVEVPDRPGGMAEIVSRIADDHINIDYAYTMIVTRHDKAIIILRVDDVHRAAAMLKTLGVRLLTEKQVTSL